MPLKNNFSSFVPLLFLNVAALFLMAACGGSSPATDVEGTQPSPSEWQVTVTPQPTATAPPTSQQPTNTPQATVRQPTATPQADDAPTPVPADDSSDLAADVHKAAELFPDVLKASLEKALGVEVRLLDIEQEYDEVRTTMGVTIDYELPEGTDLPDQSVATDVFDDVALDNGATIDQTSAGVIVFSDMEIAEVDRVKARGRIVPQHPGTAPNAQGEWVAVPDRVHIILIIQ